MAAFNLNLKCTRSLHHLYHDFQSLKFWLKKYLIEFWFYIEQVGSLQNYKSGVQGKNSAYHIVNKAHSFIDAFRSIQKRSKSRKIPHFLNNKNHQKNSKNQARNRY
jgi:hypothetical protein